MLGRYPLTYRAVVKAVASGYLARAVATAVVIVDDRTLKPFVVFAQEKHPKVWNGVQLLGCSSFRHAASSHFSDDEAL
jgi:hypothetical protein